MATALQPRLPITVRQFNRWSVDDLPSDLHSKLSKFKRNANQTLHAQDLYESAALAVKAVVEFKKQTAEARPFDTLNGLRRRLSIANKLREIAEKEILALKATCRAREVEVSSLRKQLVELSIRVRSKS
ncbi:hypothetical protein [Pelomonas sp. Root662]|uniref:hypothetical protein n=1 Tax=Pelomonas sp. Root662 TaxID=1736580 RepID=UPI0012E351AE|nr:hypothetical protein [Pelomonas sp. Root662]